MVDVARLEELGRAIMASSVEAEYLGMSQVVVYLDGAFADIVRVVAGERERVARAEQASGSGSASEGASGS